MSDVVEFPTGRSKGRKSGRQGLHAEVIIFPGVHVERREFEPARLATSLNARPAMTHAAAEPS